MSSRKQKPAGKTKHTGYQVGARKTVETDSRDAWEFLTAGEGLSIWMGESSVNALSKGTAYRLADGTEGEVRVFSDSHLRMSWHPPDWPRPSTLQLRVLSKNANRSVIAFHQEHLPGSAEREERKQYFKRVLEKLHDEFSG